MFNVLNPDFDISKPRLALMIPAPMMMASASSLAQGRRAYLWSFPAMGRSR
jgi:hypothetical protein